MEPIFQCWKKIINETSKIPYTVCQVVISALEGKWNSERTVASAGTAGAISNQARKPVLPAPLEQGEYQWRWGWRGSRWIGSETT